MKDKYVLLCVFVCGICSVTNSLNIIMHSEQRGKQTLSSKLRKQGRVKEKQK